MNRTSSNPWTRVWMGMLLRSRWLSVLLVAGVLLTAEPAASNEPLCLCVHVEENLAALLAEEDTNADKLITVADHGDRRFSLRGADGRAHRVEGTYPLGNLLQELGLAHRSGCSSTIISVAGLNEPPPRRVSRMIREHYWDGLTRSLGPEGLRRALRDEKVAAGGGGRIYVPGDDPVAYSYYRRLSAAGALTGGASPEPGLTVIRLPQHLTPEYVRSIESRPGLLSLALYRTADGLVPVPFVVPGGRFNEMYGWDSYFIVLGLLADDRVDLARAMVDNFVYQIEHYGKILNANRSYYLTRSQPPFLTSMAMAVFRRLPCTPERRDWLAAALRAAIREYETVWTQGGAAGAPTGGEGDHLTSTGLSRYHDAATGMPTEVGPAAYADVLGPLAAREGLDIATFAGLYRSGIIEVPGLDEYFVHDRAMRESGHDTSYRLVGRAASLNPVDLNALLYKYEMDIARTIRLEFGDNFEACPYRRMSSETWEKRAHRRQQRMIELMWSEQRGLFFDYDFVHQRQFEYVSATTLYPLWAGVVEGARARRLAYAALAELETAGGILSSTEAARGPVSPQRPLRQWDYPFGWAPHQMLAWEGLQRCGLHEDAERLAYRWLYMLALNAARYNGAIAEKYDMVGRTFGAEVEYGNVGIRFEYVPDGGFGWTNASFQTGLRLLSPARTRALDQMIPPEGLFPCPIGPEEGALANTSIAEPARCCLQ